ncbi:MAG: hypothetical protein GF409_07390, partial [Candidatus Omnitrophica bacterium]|nr:hypothetical protein [Candidatus Omnitrophota bacterium]
MPQTSWKQQYQYRITPYRGIGWARYNRSLKIFTWLLLFIFTFEQAGLAGDRVLHKYTYSVAKELLSDETEINSMGRMSMPYLLRAQKKHEQIIRTKNLIEEEAILFLDNSPRSSDYEETTPLKKKASSESAPEKRIEYTLSDYGESGSPQQISIYSYGENGSVLASVTSYDIRDVSADKWISTGLEEISEEDEARVMASFEQGDYKTLTEEMIVKKVAYSGKEGEERINYVLSSYCKGKPEEVSLYVYEKERKLTEVNTYDVSGMTSAYTNDEWKRFIEEKEDEWKQDVESKGRLTRKAVYEGESGEEKLVYAYSEYDDKEKPGRIDCYDYKSLRAGPLRKTRAYNIRGLDIDESLDDFRAGLQSCEERLLTTTIYTGEEDKEVIDHVLGGYYPDDGVYKPSRRTEYHYDRNGRLHLTRTYCIKGGVRILRRCSEFRGLKGKEVVTLSYDYEIDGVTLNSASLYEYDLGPDADNPHAGGDGNKYTLDRITKYVGADDPHDLAGGKIKEESYFDGPEKDEYITYSFVFDILSENTLLRKEYLYERSKLDEVNIYRTEGSDRSYDTASGTRVSYMGYSGYEGREQLDITINYDLAGRSINNTTYIYRPDGALQRTVTKDDAGRVLSRTFYQGGGGQEKRTLTGNYDLAGNTVSRVSYEYDVTDALKMSTTTNAGGSKIYETSYRGIKGSEKSSSQTRFDLAGSVISTVEYQYNSANALSKTVSRDSSGRELSEVFYEGPENYEDVVRSEQYDLEGGLLTVTEYVYDEAGALERTVTEGFTDRERNDWRRLSKTVYAGRMGREKVREITGYDYLGNELTVTGYHYAINGALEKTLTSGADGMLLAETLYGGDMSFERSESSIEYDLEGTVLSDSTYIYDASGALSATETYDHLDRKIARSVYQGQKGSEKIRFLEGYDSAGGTIKTTSYDYDPDGSLSATTVYDKDGVKVSETVFRGLMNRESAYSMRSFDDEGLEVENRTFYIYDPSGALSGSFTRDNEDNLVSETDFEGPKSREKQSISRSYDAGEALESISHYSYADNGALFKIYTNEADDQTLSSETYYRGLSGYEVSDFTLNYREDTTVRSSTYYFYTTFDEVSSSRRVVRAENAFREDPLARAQTYEGGGPDGVTTGLLLQSIAYYKGGKNKEIIDFSQEYGFKPHEPDERQIKSTIIYEYGDNRQLRASYTYSGGSEASRDTDALKRSYLSRYEGKRGKEKICYMEGTTCEYYMDDYKQWDYFIRTDFTYDDEGRNTGYFEKIFSPDTEWDWSTETAGTLIGAKSVKFSDFDEKDRYRRIEKVFYDWTSSGEAYDFTENGRKTIQQSFEYDADDNITSYLETDIDPDEGTRRNKFVFQGYTDKKPATIISLELDEGYQETGDYFKKSQIEYDEYARIKSYSAASCSEGTESYSEIFDIQYDKDLVLSEKVRTEGEFFYFGPDHSLREYKYDIRKNVETTVLTNGDYVTVTDSEGRNIYFEWSPDMAPYRETDFTSLREPEGAGPRSASLAPSSPVADALKEARKCLAPKEITGPTLISFTPEGEVDRITDTRGNVFEYADNRLTQLRDNDGNVRANVFYDTADDVLTVRMESQVDGRKAVNTYDADMRLLSAEVESAPDKTEKKETYHYVKEGSKVTKAVIHREFSEGTSWIRVDRIELYDLEERLSEIYVHSADPDGKSSISKWIAGDYDGKDRPLSCREVRLDSLLFDLEGYTDGDGLTCQDEAFGYISEYISGGDPGLDESDVLVFGDKEVLLTDQCWSATYLPDGNIATTRKTTDRFGYAPRTNAVNWSDTQHSFTVNGREKEGLAGSTCGLVYDTGTDYLDSCFSESIGGSDHRLIYSTHLFNEQIDLKEIYYAMDLTVRTTSGASANEGEAWTHLEVLRVDENGDIKVDNNGNPLWEKLENDFTEWHFNASGDKYSSMNGSKIAEGVIPVDLEGVKGLRQYVRLRTRHDVNDADGGSEYVNCKLYDLQAVTGQAEGYDFEKYSSAQTNLTVEEYDDKNNMLSYSEVKLEDNSPANCNGVSIPEDTVRTETDWQTSYEVDRTTGFEQTVRTRHITDEPDGLDITETINREDIVYSKNNITGYVETISDDSSSIVTTRAVSDISYENGRMNGFTELTERTGPGLSSSTFNRRSQLVYDGYGREIYWEDLYTPDVTEYVKSDELNQICLNDEDLKALTDAEQIRWAQQAGWRIYDELEEYRPWRRTTAVTAFDELGRHAEYLETETGYKDVGSGKPREEQEKTVKRLATVYRTGNQLKNYVERIKIIRTADASVVKDELNAVGTITYNEFGQRMSYSSWADGESSRVDTSRYNALGQLVETYTRIDAYSYSKNYYFYNEAGGISRTKTYYHFHRETEKSDRNGTYRITEHYDKTVWYDKYGEKTQEDVNQYVDVQVISTNFWSDFFGRTIISVISAVLNAVPYIGWALSLVLNSSIALANGTFDMLSLGTQLLSAGLGSGFGGLLGFSPMQEVMNMTPLGEFQNLWAGIGLGEFTEAGFGTFERFVFDAQVGALQAIVAEGVTEVGRQNEWGTFLTSAVASFSSAAVGYTYGGIIGDRGSFNNMGKFLTATAIKSIAEASINKYVEDNPSVWTRAISPIARSAVSQLFSAPKAEQRKGNKLTRLVNGLRTKVVSLFKGVTEFAGGLFGLIGTRQKDTGRSNLLRFEGYKDGESYMVFDLVDELEHEAGALVESLASREGISTLKQNWLVDGNQSLQFAMTADGERSYLMGDAGYDGLKGEALEWFERAGYGVEDKAELELNLKTGDLFMFLQVKDAVSFIESSDEAGREDLSFLKQTVLDAVGSADKLSGLEIVVKINRSGSEIVGALMRVDPAQIKDPSLSAEADQYLAKNFSGLRQGQFDLVLEVDPGARETKIRGLALKLDRVSVNKLLDDLKEQTPKLRKLAHEIKGLVELADGQIANFENIELVVGEKGEYEIHAKIRSIHLVELPGLMSKLGIEKGTPAFNSVIRKQFTDFTVFVENGAYAADLSLKCQQFEKVFMRVGDTVRKRDYKGRPVCEKVYDKNGELIMEREYSYKVPELMKALPGVGSYVNILSRINGAAKAVMTETFFVRFDDGTVKRLSRFSEGIMVCDMFVPDVDSGAAFEDLDGFAGGNFDYIVGDTVIPFSIGEDSVIRGRLPCAAMGLEVDLGGKGFAASSMGVRLEGSELVVDGEALLTVDGRDHQGVWLMETDEDVTDAMFLYDGAGLSINGNKLVVEHGDAFFSSVRRDLDGKLLPLIESLDEGAVSPDMGGTLLEKIGDAIVPYAHADSVPEVVTSSELIYGSRPEGIVPVSGAQGATVTVNVQQNLYSITPDGNIVPNRGAFEIIDGKILTGENCKLLRDNRNLKTELPEAEVLKSQLKPDLPGKIGEATVGSLMGILKLEAGKIDTDFLPVTLRELTAILSVLQYVVNSQNADFQLQFSQDVVQSSIDLLIVSLNGLKSNYAANITVFKENVERFIAAGLYASKILYAMIGGKGITVSGLKAGVNLIESTLSGISAGEEVSLGTTYQGLIKEVLYDGLVGETVDLMLRRESVNIKSRLFYSVHNHELRDRLYAEHMSVTSSVFGFSEGFLAGGVESALGLASVGVYIVRHPVSAAKKVFSLSSWKNLWRAFYSSGREYAERLELATREGIGIIAGNREKGRIVGEIAGSMFVFGKIVKGMKSSASTIGGRANGIFSRIMEKIGKGAGGKTLEGSANIKGGLGQTLWEGWTGILRRTLEKGGRIWETLRGADKKLGKPVGQGSQKGSKGFGGGGTGYRQAIGGSREGINTALKGINTALKGINTALKGIGLTRSRLYNLGKTLIGITKEIAEAYISEQSDNTIAGIRGKTPEIIEGARRLGQARQRTWSGTGLRPGWLAYGLGPLALFSMTTDATINFSRGIAGFLSPDFIDPSSRGANFWTGVYEDVSAGWDVVKDLGDKVVDWSVQIYENAETDMQARKA